MEKFPYASLYRKSFDSSAQARLLDHFGFNAAAWLVEFNRASAAVDRDAIRYLRYENRQQSYFIMLIDRVGTEYWYKREL
jgi:hypothetical protein